MNSELQSDTSNIYESCILFLTVRMFMHFIQVFFNAESTGILEFSPHPQESIPLSNLKSQLFVDFPPALFIVF